MGRALVVGSASCRALPLQTLQRLGFSCAELDDAYSAMVELCRRPLVYHALVLSLASLYREELGIISTVKRKLPHIEIWLTQTDSRLAALAEAMRLGADGLVSEDGLHRTGPGGNPPLAPVTSAPPTTPDDQPVEQRANDSIDQDSSEAHSGEPVLTADELRALLQEQPSFPPSEDR